MDVGSFLKRYLLWVGLAAVLTPLTVLLGLQYSYLVDLQKKSPIAHEATLKNYLDAAASAVEYYYRAGAERSLSLPPSIFTEERLDEAASFFSKKWLKGVRRFFVLSFVKDKAGKLYFYEPSIPSMEIPTNPAESRAIYVATGPWDVLSRKGAAPPSLGLAVDERDRAHRMILNPIVDDSGQLVGLAGMIVDEEYFREEILPMALRMSRPAFFTEQAGADLESFIHSADEAHTRQNEAEKALGFIFTDYRVDLNSRHSSPREWAQVMFQANMGMSILLALVLMGVIALALRTASREVKLSQMKSDFVSNVSHELRTPVAAIRVFGEFLKLGRAATPEKVKEYGEYIEAESRRLTRLINNILDFSKIESGRKTYEFRRTDLQEVVRDTLRTFEVRLRDSGYVIRLECPDTRLPPALIDADAIGQALNNLLDNAVKYSDEPGEIRVTLARDANGIEISVADSGVGITREEQKKIFERFHRVSEGPVHNVKGSGLGLSIVSHIVTAHHGKVGVESQPGKGSTFTITLPLDPDLPVASERAAGAPGGRTGPAIVEDTHA